MEQMEFSQGMALLTRTFHYQPTNEEKNLLWRAFHEKLDGGTWLALCAQAVQTLRHFPGVADLVQLQVKNTGGDVSPEQRAKELWALVLGLIGRYGMYHPNPLDGVAKVVVSQLGGWGRLCQEVDRMQWPFINLATRMYREGLDKEPPDEATKQLYDGVVAPAMLPGGQTNTTRLLDSPKAKPCPECPPCPKCPPCEIPDPLVRLVNDLDGLVDRMQRTKEMLGTDGLERFFRALVPRLEKEIQQAQQAISSMAKEET